MCAGGGQGPVQARVKGATAGCRIGCNHTQPGRIHIDNLLPHRKRGAQFSAPAGLLPATRACQLCQLSHRELRPLRTDAPLDDLHALGTVRAACDRTGALVATCCAVQLSRGAIGADNWGECWVKQRQEEIRGSPGPPKTLQEVTLHPASWPHSGTRGSQMAPITRGRFKPTWGIQQSVNDLNVVLRCIRHRAHTPAPLLACTAIPLKASSTYGTTVAPFHSAQPRRFQQCANSWAATCSASMAGVLPLAQEALRHAQLQATDSGGGGVQQRRSCTGHEYCGQKLNALQSTSQIFSLFIQREISTLQSALSA